MGIEFLDWVAANLHFPGLDIFMIAITTLGNNGVIWVAVVAILLARKKTRRIGVITALALLFSLLFCNLGLKLLFMRPRPFTVAGVDLLLPAPAESSFPSGHASASFAGAGGIALLGKGYAVAAYTLAALIAASRLYLYLHYPGDVLFGAALGYFCAFLARKAADRLWPEKNT